MATQASSQGQPQIQFQGPPGQKPSPEQIVAMQRQLAIDAQKNGMTVPQFIEKLKAQAMAQKQAQQRAVQNGADGQPEPPQQQQQQAQPITPGPPKPEAVAVAKFLSQDLKLRTCILNGQRKDMFKGTSPSPIQSPSLIAL